MRRNIIFDFGNVLVRWEPQLVFLPYFGGDEAKYWFFWRHVCDPVFRNRIDAGEDQMKCIREQQQLFPEYAGALDLYYTKWEDTLPGEMPGMRDLVTELKRCRRSARSGRAHPARACRPAGLCPGSSPGLRSPSAAASPRCPARGARRWFPPSGPCSGPR